MKHVKESLADQLDRALHESELDYFGGFGGEPDAPNPSGEKPWPTDHRHGREVGSKEVTPLVLGASVVVRTKDGVAVAEGYIEDILDETRIVRVRDTSSGSDVQVDVDPDRYDIWILDPDVVGDSPDPEPNRGPNYVRSKAGPYKGAPGR